MTSSITLKCEVSNVKTDIRKQISDLSNDIGSVVSKADGTLQICYYAHLEEVKNEVWRFLSSKSLLDCFTEIQFVQTPIPPTSFDVGIRAGDLL